MRTDTVIAVDGLVKRYRSKVAVNGLSFEVRAGEVYGLLGVNGAGKTTTIEILEGHRTRDAGTVTVLGEDPGRAGRAFRDRIGIVLQSSGVESKLTVREVLDLYRAVYTRPRSTAECIELLGLTESADKRIEHLSGGQKRRLDLALGVIGQPQLLFLDEPTTGFDPSARRASWELVRSLAASGATVILTSHYLDEVEYLADRVGVMADGTMVLEGATHELLASSGRTRIRFRCPEGVNVAEMRSVLDAGRGDPSSDVTLTDSNIEVTTSTPTSALAALTAWAVERGEELVDIDVGRPSLEDLFLGITSEPEGGPTHDLAAQ